jgi:hypothetical protein
MRTPQILIRIAGSMAFNDGSSKERRAMAQATGEIVVLIAKFMDEAENIRKSPGRLPARPKAPAGVLPVISKRWWDVSTIPVSGIKRLIWRRSAHRRTRRAGARCPDVGSVSAAPPVSAGARVLCWRGARGTPGGPARGAGAPNAAARGGAAADAQARGANANVSWRRGGPVQHRHSQPVAAWAWQWDSRTIGSGTNRVARMGLRSVSTAVSGG